VSPAIKAASGTIVGPTVIAIIPYPWSNCKWWSFCIRKRLTGLSFSVTAILARFQEWAIQHTEIQNRLRSVILRKRCSRNHVSPRACKAGNKHESPRSFSRNVVQTFGVVLPLAMTSKGAGVPGLNGISTALFALP
jgi:hypothetical protein